MIRLVPLFVVVLLSTITQYINAAIIIDTPAWPTGQIIPAIEIGNRNPQAQSFTLPSGSDYVFESITMELLRDQDRSGGDGMLDPYLDTRTFDIFLYNDADGLPGSQVGIISSANSYAAIKPAGTYDRQNYTFATQDEIHLTADSTYWIVVTMEKQTAPGYLSSTSIYWYSAIPFGYTGVAADGPLDYAWYDSGAGEWISSPGFTARFTVTARETVIPEPASWGMIISLCWLVIVICLRRKPIADIR
ncbi:hypothetical protein OpiT1DRAFT_00005 [Opitutaceae bacterium TAV1]|nr:hypothetical protein OpiT1DRAFT_00005 [Opitutaceae bacterium TAV1]